MRIDSMKTGEMWELDGCDKDGNPLISSHAWWKE